jgi:predicted transcriptional regulator
MTDTSRPDIVYHPSRKGMEKFCGTLEALVLETVWDCGPVTVKRALYYINKKHAYAYTSIMTILNRLVKKSFLTREKKGHSFIYKPIMGKSEFIKYASDLIISELKKDFGNLSDNQPKRKKSRKQTNG